MSVTQELRILLHQDLVRSAELAAREYGLVNVSRLAEEVRLRNEEANVAIEDIESMLLAVGEQLSLSLEFDRMAGLEA